MTTILLVDDDPGVAVVELLQARVGELHVDPGGPVEGIDPGVAGDEDLGDGDVLADEVLEVARGRREVEGGDRRDHLPVQLLRERREVRAAGPQPGLDVHHRDPEVEGGERRRHRRGGVAVDQGRGGAAAAEDVVGARMGIGVDVEALDAEVFEALHHRSHPLVQVGAPRAGPEGDVGLDLGELEDVLDEPVVLAGGDDDRLVVPALAEGEDHRHQLDRLGPGADDDRDLELPGNAFRRERGHLLRPISEADRKP